MLLGCIGDDFTGSSDLANTLSGEGMRVALYPGVPNGNAAPGVEAGVVALKSRSIPAKEAVRRSLEALDWLQAQGCRQFVFKVCSTFDSTPDGNIGPVAEALAARLGTRGSIVCPAFPATGRSVYLGHLFVGDTLLNESGLQNHPLTPMTDPDLRRWLARQTDGTVGHVAWPTVAAGSEAITAALAEQAEAGHVLVIVDAVRDEDLRAIGTAASGAALLTGGSGIALGLPENLRRAGELTGNAGTWRGESGPAIVLSGSCSVATRAQLAAHRGHGTMIELVADEVLAGHVDAADVATRLLTADGLPVAYSSDAPEAVRAVQERHGREASAAAFETLFADIARHLVAGGTKRLIVAGGETSGAVVDALAPDELGIGPEIDPGVPALRAGADLVIALKSGNFGAPDFFVKAATVLAGASATTRSD